MSFFIRADVSGFIPDVSYDIEVFSFYRLFRFFTLKQYICIYAIFQLN